MWCCLRQAIWIPSDTVDAAFVERPQRLSMPFIRRFMLVIFVIRTRGRPWHSRPSQPLAWTSLAVVMCALLLPWMPFASGIGFAPLPAEFCVILLLLVAAYLCVVELVKRWFYRHFAGDF